MRTRAMAMVITLSIFCLPMYAGTPRATSPDRQVSGKTLNVLFIGNSYTYFNNMPQLLEQLASAGGQGKIQTTMVAEGGATLEDMWEGGKALKAIRQGAWDYVVLQPQSTFGTLYIVNGQERVGNPDLFFRYARLFDEEIASSGGRTVFPAHWKKEHAPVRDQVALNVAYTTIGKELNAIIIPIGMAWQRMRAAHPEVTLYSSDGSHPTGAGSYLAACTFYSFFVGESPVGLPGRLSGHPVEENNGAVFTDKITELVKLQRSEAEALQRAAWQAHEDLKASNGYFPVSDVPPIVRPEIPTGTIVNAAELVGEWVGHARHYPKDFTWPAAMNLSMRQSDGNLLATVTISFGGRPNDIVREELEVAISGKSIEFVDPDGPDDGSIVRYRGVRTGQGMRGIAEILTDDHSLYSIGEWDLQKEH